MPHSEDEGQDYISPDALGCSSQDALGQTEKKPAVPTQWHSWSTVMKNSCLPWFTEATHGDQIILPMANEEKNIRGQGKDRAFLIFNLLQSHITACHCSGLNKRSLYLHFSNVKDPVTALTNRVWWKVSRAMLWNQTSGNPFFYFCLAVRKPKLRSTGSNMERAPEVPVMSAQAPDE